MLTLSGGQAETLFDLGLPVEVYELCENTRRGARGLIVPLATSIGSPNESNLLPTTGRQLDQLGLRPKEIALDGGFDRRPVAQLLPPPDRLLIAGKHTPGSRKTNRRPHHNGLGDPGLQPRHPRHPQRLTPSTPGGSRPEPPIRTAASPPERGRSSFTQIPIPRNRLSAASS